MTGNSRWDFIATPELKLRVWLAGEPREQVMAATGIGYTTIDSKVPCLLRRVTGRHARFAAVYDLGGKGRFIVGVETERGDDRTGWLWRQRSGKRAGYFFRPWRRESNITGKYR